MKYLIPFKTRSGLKTLKNNNISNLLSSKFPGNCSVSSGAGSLYQFNHSSSSFIKSSTTFEYFLPITCKC